MMMRLSLRNINPVYQIMLDTLSRRVSVQTARCKQYARSEELRHCKPKKGHKRQSNRQFSTMTGFVALSAALHSRPESSDSDDLNALLNKAELMTQKRYSKKNIEKVYLEALHVAIELEDKSTVAHVQEKLANIAIELGDYDSALKLLPNVIRNLLDIGFEENSLKVLEVSLKLATIYASMQKHELAVNGYEWVIKQMKEYLNAEENYKDGRAFLGMALDSYGRYLFKLNKTKQALDVTKEAIAISINLFGESDVRTLVLLNDIGAILTDCGEFDEAKEIIKKAIKRSKECVDIKHSDVAIFWVNLGSIYIRQNNAEEAKHAFRNAKREAVLSKDRSLLMQIDHYIAEQSS